MKREERKQKGENICKKKGGGKRKERINTDETHAIGEALKEKEEEEKGFLLT